ncbi:MAG: peptidoglycan bridge formation glycyltransferase FemA/FemB family protein [Ardenticatenales bacterium]
MMRRIEDADAWDALLLRLGRAAPSEPAEPAPHLLQGWRWGEIKERWGWRVERWAWGEPDAEFAAVQVMRRRVGRLPFAMAYAPKGPFVAAPTDGDDNADARDNADAGDNGTASRWHTVLGDLEAWARRARVAVVKIDPDVDAACEDVAALWRARGWVPSPEQIQFPNTMRSTLVLGDAAAVDAGDGVDDRGMAAYKPKTRYNVRLAARRGVVVRCGGQDDLDAFYELYATTAARQGFGIRARAYYLDVWSSYLAAGDAVVLMAERDGRALAGAIPIRFGTTAWYLYGASADEGREDMAPYAVMHACLRWAAERGCTTFDWWGGPTTADAADPLAGVGRFKEGFGAAWAPQLGAYDFAASPLKARLLDAAGAVRRAWLRRASKRGP